MYLTCSFFIIESQARNQYLVMDKTGDNNKSELHHPHDNLFKAAFYNKSVACDFLSNRLPADIKKRINLDTLKLEHCSFVNEKLKRKHSDVVYSANIDGKPGYVYTLIEQQSTIDNRQVVRLMKYNALLLERHYDQYPEQEKIPAIINLVLYTGSETYRGPQSIAEAFQHPDLFIKSLTIPFVIKAKEENIKSLLADKSAALVSILLRAGKLRDLCRLLDDPLVLKLIYKSVYRKRAIFYIINHDKHGPEHVLKKLHKLAAKEKQEIMGYVALKMKQTRTESLAEGMAKGKAEGFSEALNALVKKGLITPEKAAELMAEKRN